GGPGVADRADAVDVAKEPADAEGVAQADASQLDRLLLHLLQHANGQDLFAALCAAVTEVEPCPTELVGRRGGEAPARVVAAPVPPGSSEAEPSVLGRVVAQGEAPGHDVVTVEEAVREAEWLQ